MMYLLCCTTLSNMAESECARVTKQHLQCPASHAVSGQWELVACSAQRPTRSVGSGSWSLAVRSVPLGQFCASAIPGI
jgi:hypothetical protein